VYIIFDEQHLFCLMRQKRVWSYLSAAAHICWKWSHDKFGMHDLHSWP